jgi:type IV pilus assembly protein PilB
MVPKQNFEQFLIENQLVNPDSLKSAQEEAQARRVTLYQCLVEKAVFTTEQLAQALAKFHKTEYRPMPLKFDASLAKLIPQFTLRRYKIFPVEKTEKDIVLAMVDPGNFLATDEVKRLLKINVRSVVTTEAAISEALMRLGGGAASKETVVPQGAPGPGPLTQPPAPVAAAAAPQASGNDTAGIADQLIEHALQLSASDIHFEPQANGTGIIRERVDGILHEVRKVPLDQLVPIVSRIKLLAGMDVVEKRLSQDGRFKHRHTRGTCEIRASILPTIYGEKLVLRLLRNDKLDITVDALDIGAKRIEALRTICSLPDGLVVVAGPTGCGKSTTLYAMLRALDRKTQNVITVEDPVEYELDLINQVQVNNKIGITFASTLPTILRQDPDIVLIGEIRDEETAAMVMRTAISGHLVFSTIHAPNTLETVIRLTDMGVEPHMVVAALKAAISQRLLRKLCSKCKRPVQATSVDKKCLGIPEAQNVQIFQAAGCSACHNLGFSGRFIVIEILTLNEALYDAILRKDRTNLPAIAKASGFKNMLDHARERVLAGETTVTEMMANCPRPV